MQAAGQCWTARESPEPELQYGRMLSIQRVGGKGGICTGWARSRSQARLPRQEVRFHATAAARRQERARGAAALPRGVHGAGPLLFTAWCRPPRSYPPGTRRLPSHCLSAAWSVSAAQPPDPVCALQRCGRPLQRLSCPAPPLRESRRRCSGHGKKRALCVHRKKGRRALCAYASATSPLSGPLAVAGPRIGGFAVLQQPLSPAGCGVGGVVTERSAGGAGAVDEPRGGLHAALPVLPAPGTGGSHIRAASLSWKGARIRIREPPDIAVLKSRQRRFQAPYGQAGGYLTARPAVLSPTSLPACTKPRSRTACSRHIAGQLTAWRYITWTVARRRRSAASAGARYPGPVWPALTPAKAGLG